MFNLNIEKYSLNEMEKLLQLNHPYRENDINESITNIHNNLSSDSKMSNTEKKKLQMFLNNVSKKLKDNIKNTENSNINNIIQKPVKEKNIGRVVGSNNAPTGNLNPINYRTIKKTINIDTRFRSNYDNTESSDIHIDLPMTVKNVLSIELASIEIPLSYYAFSKEQKNVSFDVSYVVPVVLLLPDNISTIYYDKNDAVDISDGNYFHDFNKSSNDLSNNIEREINNYIKTAKLKFYINNVNGHSCFQNIDPCNCTIHFHKDTTVAKQMTLGWKLGFRKEEINIDAGKTVESEAVCDLTGPKYMYVVVDDFNNNTNNYFQSAFSESILNQNILARINLSSMKKTNGDFGNYSNDNFVTQIHGLRKRNYFGPVDIQKLRVQLLDEYGRVINLNKMDWSCALTFEVLYD